MVRSAALPNVPGHSYCPRHGRGGRDPWACPDCPTVLREKPKAAKAAKPSSWSAARDTACESGHNHPSKTEARVCNRLTRECLAGGTTLYRNIRLPLVSIAPKPETGAALYLTVDFGIVKGGRLVRLIDAKTRRVSRDWKRGARACESAWGIQIEEVAR